jgi:truncated hemoglobin YjbI
MQKQWKGQEIEECHQEVNNQCLANSRPTIDKSHFNRMLQYFQEAMRVINIPDDLQLEFFGVIDRFKSDVATVVEENHEQVISIVVQKIISKA